MSTVTFMGIMAWAILIALMVMIVCSCIKEPPWKEIKRLLEEIDEGGNENE